jgi:hypothetical protein
MHCELAVPALFASPAGGRLPALELLLARSRRSGSDAQTLEPWLNELFLGEDEPLAAGALTVLADGGEPGAHRWARADPVHLRLMRDRLILAPSAAFTLSGEEAQSLCEALNRHFAGVLTLHPYHPGRWCARLEEEFALEAVSPLELAGRDVDLGLPRGSGAGRWQAVLNEAQMLLHAHPVNEAREARGEPTVNSLWLWGAGTAPKAEAGPWQGVLADEPIAIGLGRLAGARHRALPESADAWLERAPDDGRHLIVLDSLRTSFLLSQEAAYREAFAVLERQWFAPLLLALREGRIGMVTIHVPEAGNSFEAIRGDLRRFWRRPRPIEQYA